MISSFRRTAAPVLFAAGVALVSAGFSAALGFTLPGLVASLAAIATLVYAGAVWFGAPGPERAVSEPVPHLILFDRNCRIVSGAAPGHPVAAPFPEMLRPEIDRRCRTALSGNGERFPCLYNGRLVLFEALPVRSADGNVVCGVLVSTHADTAAT